MRKQLSHKRWTTRSIWPRITYTDTDLIRYVLKTKSIPNSIRLERVFTSLRWVMSRA
jgi:hypothetical protein